MVLDKTIKSYYNRMRCILSSCARNFLLEMYIINKDGNFNEPNE